MGNSPTTHSSYIEIIKQVYDNPSNSNIVKLLDEAGIEKNRLQNIVVNHSIDDMDMAYVLRFLKISSSSVDLV